MKKIFLVLAVIICLNANFIASADPLYYGEQETAYEKALQLFNSYQYSAAVNEFKKILRNTPDDMNAKIGLINSYLARASYFANNSKDYNKAGTDLKSALFYLQYFTGTPANDITRNAITETKANLAKIQNLSSENSSAQQRFNVAKSLRLQGEFAAAAYDFIQLSNIDSVKNESLIQVGDIMKLLGSPQLSLSYYQKALQLNPNSDEIHLKLAGVYEKLGKIEQATAEYNSIMEHSSENKEVLNSLENIWYMKTQQNPKDAEAHANLGAVYQKENALDEALREYQIAEKLNPSNVNTRLNIGTLYQQKKDYNTAIAAYNSILSLYPKHEKAILFKAQCNAYLGNKEDAKEGYQQYLQLCPNDLSAKNEMLTLLKSNMSPQEILDIMYQEVKNNPQNADVHYKYAYELHKNNKLDDAITHYEIALSLNPKIEDAYINLAQAYKQKGNIEKSNEIISKAKTQIANSKSINEYQKTTIAELQDKLYKLATDDFVKGDYQKAIEGYKKIQPATVDSLVGIGSSYQALNDYKASIESFKQALNIEPNNHELLYYIALAYSNLNDFENAKLYSKKALAISKNDKVQSLYDYVIEQEVSQKLQKAFELYEKENYKDAVTLLNSLISQNAKNAYAHYYKALCLDGLKSYKEAITEYLSAIKYSNEMDIAYYSIAVDYDYMENYADALKYYELYTSKVKEENDYTKYAKERADELRPYVKK